MRLCTIGVCAIIFLSAGSANAGCTSPRTPMKIDLTSMIVDGVIAPATQTFTIEAGCTEPFHIAIMAAPAKVDGNTVSGFENTIGYTATASVGGISTVMAASATATSIKKVVSQQTKSGVRGTVPIAVTVSPRPGGHLLPGNYAGQLVVTVCEKPKDC